jgi:hypothetical protein
MDADITVAVVVFGAEVYLLTDNMPADIRPFRFVGTLTYRGGQCIVERAGTDAESILILGVALNAFAEHVAKVKSSAQTGDSVEWLRRLLRLPDSRDF